MDAKIEPHAVPARPERLVCCTRTDTVNPSYLLQENGRSIKRAAFSTDKATW